MIENFVFNDIVLYAKGWYKKSGDIVKDLGYLFSKIYAWEPTTEAEISAFMLMVLDKVYDEKCIMFKADSCLHCFSGFYNSIKKRMALYDISFDRAIILEVLGILQAMPRDEIKLKAPHYGKKEHFRMGRLFGEYPISMTYTEMNKIAQRTFNS